MDRDLEGALPNFNFAEVHQDDRLTLYDWEAFFCGAGPPCDLYPRRVAR